MKYPMDFNIDTTHYENMFGSYFDKQKELNELYNYMQLDLERVPTTETKKTKKAPTAFSE